MQLDSATAGRTSPTSNAALHLISLNIASLLCKGNESCLLRGGDLQTGCRSNQSARTVILTKLRLQCQSHFMAAVLKSASATDRKVLRLAAHPILGQKSNTFSVRCNNQAEKNRLILSRLTGRIRPSSVMISVTSSAGVTSKAGL